MQTVTPHRRTAEDHFEVVIRLRQSANNQPSDATLRLRAQALLKDLLMSRLQVEAEINAHEYVHTRGFGDLGRALAATRALQLAFEGFRTVVPGARANLSVVLDSSVPEETAQDGLSVEQKDLLDFSKPSQVLITQAFYDRIAPYQPALRSSTLRAGVYEFLWTGEERLNELQAEAEFMPTLIQRPTPTAAPIAETTIVPAVKSIPVSRWKEPDPTYTPALEPAPAADGHVPSKWLSAPRILAICSAIAILFTIGYLINFFLLGNGSKPASQVTRQGGPAPGTRTPDVTQTPPAKTAGPPPPAASDVPKVTTPPPIVKPPKPPVVVSDASSLSQQPAPKPATRSRNCSIEVDEIPGYLNLAERYRSRGSYDRAISNYNLVLGCQPGNRPALDGLKKAQDAEKYSSP
jgi:hypothetical protein